MNDPVASATQAVDLLGSMFLDGDTAAVCALFADTGEVVYAGSEPGEIAVGLTALAALLDQLFSREERYCWRATSVAAFNSAGLLFVVADSELSVHPVDADQSAGPASERAPYRISGVLEPHGSSWRWRLCQGSEPSAA